MIRSYSFNKTYLTILISRRKHEKNPFTLSLSLSFLLHAEDDGFYTSVGYQIGEAAQMVTNTKGIQ
ncbi:hypothetical protein, partial [Helicobacter pylori]|uniref:hypothetical protein n=1 Tax=Helicobacter pylori TaxID=210 RepID=UPI00280A7858